MTTQPVESTFAAAAARRRQLITEALHATLKAGGFRISYYVAHTSRTEATQFVRFFTAHTGGRILSISSCVAQYLELNYDHRYDALRVECHKDQRHVGESLIKDIADRMGVAIKEEKL
jgi:hypothetical protein